VWWVREALDINAMRDAAEVFLGMKDFAAFTDDDPEEKSTRVLVERLEIVEAGALILVRVQGSHFLWKMVRRMVGVLAASGRGELRSADAVRLLDDQEPLPRGVTPAALTAPAAGLFLERVLYMGDDSIGPIRPVVWIE
jgi:tRNA pseudouridine38-40 synthase